MYPEYFGLTEASFSITPDPQYLYLSDQHREALAHLLFGTGDSGGFVQLTGEVGTGKTTVCRAFLEQLPEHVDVALILNPALTVPELLRAICKEFHIEVSDEENSTKVLVDRLNEYLLAAHARGRRPVLMIDEAQNLKPEVLEQIRLLTNLETTKHKLLQIFLVGQPELREVLDQKGLRQLAQRITARYHLQPLDPRETDDYIQHRLAVAGVKQRLFTPRAVKRIYRITGGVPRLINILCDRSLLGAYATDSRIVDGAIVGRAAHEFQGEQPLLGWTRWRQGVQFAALMLVVAIGAGLLPKTWITYTESPPSPDEPTTTLNENQPVQEGLPAGDNLVDAAEQNQALEPEEGAEASTDAETDEIQASVAATSDGTAQGDETPQPPPLNSLIMDERTAMVQLLEKWGMELPDGVDVDPCELAENGGLACRRGNGSWSSLRVNDRPCLIKLHDYEGKTGYAFLTGLDESLATLRQGPLRAQMPVDELDAYWRGEFLLLWQLPPTGTALIGPGSPGDSVRWLKEMLAQVPGMPPQDLEFGNYNRELKAAIQQFQSQRGLKPDGIVGPDTLLHLNTAAGLPDIPRLETHP